MNDAFRINDYLELRLENDKTNIYVNGGAFMQCRYLLINIPVDKIRDYGDINSIDEAAETLDKSLEGRSYKYNIPPETEFWGHSSNLQAWAENDYDTRLLHSNISFPLLKKLTEAGDPIARKVFKDEIGKRLGTGCESVRNYLIEKNYVKYLNEEELECIIMNDESIKEKLSKHRSRNTAPISGIHSGAATLKMRDFKFEETINFWKEYIPILLKSYGESVGEYFKSQDDNKE